MNKLNYKTLEEVGYKGYILKNAPVKVLQFGEGNFLVASGRKTKTEENGFREISIFKDGVVL